MYLGELYTNLRDCFMENEKEIAYLNLALKTENIGNVEMTLPFTKEYKKELTFRVDMATKILKLINLTLKTQKKSTL